MTLRRGYENTASSLFPYGLVLHEEDATPRDVGLPRIWRELAEDLDAIVRGPRIVPSV